MDSLLIATSIGVGILLVVAVVFLMMVTRFYVKAPADRAFVKTGGGKPKVVVNGGSWVIPAFHEITWVDLRTMDIDIERTEASALLTIDPQYADIRAIFYIKVNPVTEGIERAARTIGGGEINNDNIKRLVESKLEGALRDVAATFSLMSLHQEREKFVERVQNLVRQDLDENGLVLESVSITTLKSARQGSFGIDDVFGAQVARANAQVIQNALRERNEIDQLTQTEIAKRNATAEQERNDIERKKQLEISRRNSSVQQETNDIERSAELEIATRNATVEQEKLSLERNISQARATQQREILIREAEEKSAADQASFTQQQAAELSRVVKERAIAEAEKEKEQAVQLAEQRKQQAIQLAEQEREREVRRSEVFKQQTIEVADQERKVALAQQQAKLESAEQERLTIAAQREQAEQEVFTVRATAEARREAQIQIINAERDAQREMISRKNAVELETLRQIKGAEAEATAAIRLAEARRTEAQAASDSEKLKAEATRASSAASGLAEAEVLKAKAEAAGMEAEAIRARGLAEADAMRAKSLAEAEGQRSMSDALAANDFAAQRLEIEKTRLQAQIEIGVAQAQAMGVAMASMEFKLYGTPDTAQQILRMISLSDGLGNLIETAPTPLKQLGERLLDRFAPANGATIAPATPPSGSGDGVAVGFGAAQPLFDAAAAVLKDHLSPAERQRLTVREGIAQALTVANTEQRATLLRAEGMLTLVPAVAGQTVALVIGE